MRITNINTLSSFFDRLITERIKHYFFKHNEDTMTEENNTKFIVEILGLRVFSIDSKSKEIYQKDKLISFE